MFPKLELNSRNHGQDKVIDYYIETDLGNFFVEIKEFQSETKLDGNFNLGEKEINGIKIKQGTYSLTIEEILHPYINHIKKANKQFSEYINYELPCLLVFDNCNNHIIDNDPIMLLQLFGQIVYSVPFDIERGALITKNGNWTLLNNGIFKDNKFTSISAFAFMLLYDNNFFLRLFHNPFAKIAFSQQIFHEKYDEQYVLEISDDNVICKKIC